MKFVAAPELQTTDWLNTDEPVLLGALRGNIAELIGWCPTDTLICQAVRKKSTEHVHAGDSTYPRCWGSKSLPANRMAAPSIKVPQTRLMRLKACLRIRTAALWASQPQANRMIPSTSR